MELDVLYYTYEDMDRLYLEKANKEISLQIASSGLQSVVPLLTLADYTLRGIYNEYRPMSVTEQDGLVKEYRKLLSQKRENNDSIDSKDLDMLINLILSKNYANSHLIIEEPEQNLFPSTQRELVYYLLQLITGERDHRLTLTTHSPYILYALNNCMLGHLVQTQLQGEEKDEYIANNFVSKQSWIDPELVSVWEIEEGELRSIQDKDKIISENYFDQKMTEITEEYDQMLSYYKNEE